MYGRKPEVWEEQIASIFKVEEEAKQETRKGKQQDEQTMHRKWGLI